MASVIHATAHGFTAGSRIYFGNLVGGDGIVEGQVYYVIAAGLTADAFEFSETSGGTAFTFTSDITEGVVSGAAIYTATTDPADVMAPPVAPAAPGSCVLSSAVTVAPDGTAITRLTVTITQPTSATLRHTIVTVTGGSNTAKVVIPVGQTTGSIASVVPGVSYTGSAVAYDTFGLASTATTSAAHTAAGDTTAPATPTGLAASAGILGNIVSWASNTEADLDHYELAYATDGVTFSVIRVAGSVVALTALVAGTTYTYKVRAVDASGNASSYTATTTAVPRQVTGSGLSGTDIAALSISGADIKAATITAAKIAAGTITANEIAAGTITANEIAALTIVAANIAAGTITGAKIAAGTITASNIAADTITANEIAASAITTSELAAGAVTAAKITAGTITANEIAAATITAAKMAANSIRVGALAQAQGQLVTNGGFELDGDTSFGDPLTGWTVTNGSIANFQTSAVVAPNGGLYSLVIQSVNGTAQRLLMADFAAVEPSKRYRFSASTQGAVGNNAGCQMLYRVRWFDASLGAISSASTTVTVGATVVWAESFTIRTAPASAAYVKIEVEALTGNVTNDIVRVDDVSIYRVDQDVSHAAGDVTIDSTGVTINNGKLTLQDEFGKTVQTASGFSGNWADFIQTGLYNGRFLQGTAGAIASGRTSALPYWTLANTTGSPVATFVANGGVAVTFAALSNKKSFTSDAISVHPAAIYQGSFMVSVNKGGGTLFLILAPFIDWFQADGSTASAITATTTLDTSSFSATLSATAINNLLPVRPPSDARFAKLRFTVEESSIGTHTAGNSLTLLSASLKEVGNTTVGKGQAFPTTPVTNDLFYRTDLGFEFYFDGTRWLSTQMFAAVSGIEANTTTYAISFAATSARVLMANLVPPNVATDVWIDSITMGAHIASGGTALGASHNWVMTFQKGTPLSPATSVGSITINSGSSGVWRPVSVAIGALLGLANSVISMDLTKTGTPGAFQVMSPFTVFYRIVTT